VIPPSVALVGIGIRSWRPILPIPVFLLWPIVALGLAILALVELVWGRPVRLASLVGAGVCQLHGLKVDLETARGRRAFVWML